MGHLYRLEFPNGKSYIGITSKTASVRFRGHISRSRDLKDQRSRSPLYSAWRVYGAPKLTILAESDDWDALCNMETFAIFQYRTLSPEGYNLTIGGEGTVGVTRSEETKDKLRAALARRTPPNTGIRHTEEAKEKMSKARKGRPPWNKGIPTSAEVKEVLRKASSGRKHSAESIAKMRVASGSRAITAETRIKMATSRKANAAVKRAQQLHSGEIL